VKGERLDINTFVQHENQNRQNEDMRNNLCIQACVMRARIQSSESAVKTPKLCILSLTTFTTTQLYGTNMREKQFNISQAKSIYAGFENLTAVTLKIKNVKLSLKGAVETHRVMRRRGSHIFQTTSSQMAVRSSALRAGRTFIPRKIPGTISVSE
jgi:hypothetical protein